jgi:hypothetical protein
MRGCVLFAVAWLGACGSPGIHSAEPDRPRFHGPPSITFVQDDTTTYRMSDLDGDGDYNEVGETTTFFVGPSGRICALDAATVLTIDGPGSTRVLQLRDLDDNGDAMGTGEVSVWFSGDGTEGQFARDLVRAPDGDAYMLVAGHDRFRVYRLRDDNLDGDANDAEEATLVHELPIGWAPETIAVDGRGDIWLLGPHPDYAFSKALYRAGAEGLELMLDPAYFAEHEWTPTGGLAADRDGRMLVGAHARARLPRGTVLFAVVGVNEVQILWESDHSDFPCLFSSLQGLTDGSIVGQCAGHFEFPLIRHVDANGNGYFAEPGEAYVIYDAHFARLNGVTAPEFPANFSAVVP